MIGENQFKLHIFQLQPACLPPRPGNHVRNRINSANSAQRSNQRHNAQSRLPRTCRDIQHRLPHANPRLRNKPRSNWPKHMPDHLPMLIPKRRRPAPTANDLVVRFHAREYIHPPAIVTTSATCPTPAPSFRSGAASAQPPRNPNSAEAMRHLYDDFTTTAAPENMLDPGTVPTTKLLM